MKKKISILGSTGSIGTQALEVIENLKDKFEIISLSAGHNIDLLNKQIEKFKPESVCVMSGAKDVIGCANVYVGESGLCQICSNNKNDIILVAVSGMAGIKPVLSAIKNRINIALANKEALVAAGDIIMKLARENNVDILPVDSEHCAIHQCIKDITQVRGLIITASGGPFWNKPDDEIKNACIEQALAHPRWKMGKKITVDSATLMNKGLEVIEAHHLFNMPYDDIKVVIHPQSIVHSAVEYIDGSVTAQLGIPSMHLPVQYALCYPERYEGLKSRSFSFVDAAKLEFYPPDYNRFKFLDLAYNAGRTGGSAPVILNAADEAAVYAFLDGKIKFQDIYNITEKIYSKFTFVKDPPIDEIFELDNEARIKTNELIQRSCQCLSI